MDKRLPRASIEAFLHYHLQPYDCECRWQSDNQMSVRLFQAQDESDALTTLGISREQCRDAANLVRLAQELRIELYATLGSLPDEGPKAGEALRSA